MAEQQGLEQALLPHQKQSQRAQMRLMLRLGQRQSLDQEQTELVLVHPTYSCQASQLQVRELVAVLEQQPEALPP